MQSAEKLSITLPPEMAHFIRQKVASGLYGSNSEIIREALRGLMERERCLERLDGAIALGLADAEAGRVQEMAQEHGFFSGDPCARWLTEISSDRKMRLVEEFTFTDPDGLTWVAPSGYEVDGASIPKALWSLVGSPYTGDYRRASIVHDKACNDAAGDVTARKAADRMFYHACRAGGCSSEEANNLYLGVRIGALGDVVPLWSLGIEESFAPRPRTSLPPSERRIEADFRVASDLILRQGATDDPFVLEQRVDSAIEAVGGQ